MHRNFLSCSFIAVALVLSQTALADDVILTKVATASATARAIVSDLGQVAFLDNGQIQIVDGFGKRTIAQPGATMTDLGVFIDAVTGPSNEPNASPFWFIGPSQVAFCATFHDKNNRAGVGLFYSTGRPGFKAVSLQTFVGNTANLALCDVTESGQWAVAGNDDTNMGLYYGDIRANGLYNNLFPLVTNQGDFFNINALRCDPSGGCFANVLDGDSTIKNALVKFTTGVPSVWRPFNLSATNFSAGANLVSGTDPNGRLVVLNNNVLSVRGDNNYDWSFASMVNRGGEVFAEMQFLGSQYFVQSFAHNNFTIQSSFNPATNVLSINDIGATAEVYQNASVGQTLSMNFVDGGYVFMFPGISVGSQTVTNFSVEPRHFLNRRNEMVFTYQSASGSGICWGRANCPILYGGAPASLPSGSPDTLIPMTGFNYDLNATMLVNGTPVPINATSAVECDFVIPASMLAAPGTLTIRAQNPGTTVKSNPITIKVTAPTT